jgi:putative alpha-1,2-mannosidase
MFIFPKSPFFEQITIRLPSSSQGSAEKTLTIVAKDAPTKPYIKSLTVNGQPIHGPIISHDQIRNGGLIEFEMSAQVEKWGNALTVEKTEGETADTQSEYVLYEEKTGHSEL